jgi:RimJ/RimL family protein N-acetyltransferase
MSLSPVTLVGRLVRLEPLQLHHAKELYQASQDQRIWAYMSLNPSVSLDVMTTWIASALREQQVGTILPFAIVDIATGHAVGSTRYMNIMLHDRGLEIGWTWLAPEVQRTGVNTECKYLLLRHAFETLKMIRVQFKTDSRNLKSQQAIERIGGKREGVLRNHMILHDGYIRHSVYFSIIDSEWPDVKAALEQKLARN